MKNRIFYSILLVVILGSSLIFLISCSKDESMETGKSDSIGIEEPQGSQGDSEPYRKAKESFQSGRYQEALNQFKKLSEKDKRAVVGVGLSYYMLEDYLNTAIYLDEALTYNSDDFIAQKFLAFSYSHLNEIEKSLTHAEKALAIKQDEELTELHRELIQHSRQKGSTETLQAAQKLFEKGDYKRALTLYKESARDDKSALVGVGLSQYMLGDYVNAILNLEESLSNKSNNFEARKCLAFAYDQVNESEKSLSHAMAALSLRKDKDLQNLYNKLTHNDALQKNDVQKNKTTIKRGDQKTWQEAKARFQGGNYEGAAHLYKKLARTDKKAYTFVGHSYFNLKNYDIAIDYLKKALDYNSKDFTAYKLLAFAYNETQDMNKSHSYAKKGLALRRDRELQFLYNRLQKDQKTWDDYAKSETSHFTLLYDGEVHSDARRKITDILEDGYGTIGRQLNYFPSQKITVILYTRKKFMDVTKAPGWAGALYDGKIRMPIKGIQGRDNILERILFHEYTHALVHSITPNCPLWINEGLAEYFSKKSPRKIGQVIPLRNLERTFMHLSGRRVSDAYLESYSAVSDLIDKYGLYSMKKLLFAFVGSSNYNEAFSSALSVSYDDFVSHWGKG